MRIGQIMKWRKKGLQRTVLCNTYGCEKMDVVEKYCGDKEAR
jgi:hypothetical protein